jgi:two-component system, sensor histidine kinase LadS
MKRAVIILSLIFCSGLTFGQVILEVNDETDERVLLPSDLLYLVDSTNSLSFETVSSHAYADKFQQHSSYQNKDFLTNASYWIKIPIRHKASSNKMWLLEFYDQSIDHLEAFVPREDGSYERRAMGDNELFSNRLFRHKNFEIPIKMISDSVLVYYFRVRSHEFADLRIPFRSINRFVYYSLNEYFLFGTFYGMILIISLYNFLVYLAIREIKNIYYIFYILSVAMYAMSLDGIGFQYIWPNYPQWNDVATGVFLYSLILWSLVFTRRFLSTRANAPALDRVLIGMIIGRTVLFVITLLFHQPLFAYRNIEIIPLSLIFYTGIKVWLGGYRPARFFVIAYGVLFFGFFVRSLVFVNILPLTTVLHYSVHFSFVFEMLFLTMALGDRIRILKDNRDRALRRIIKQHEFNMRLKDKVNRELEDKVAERTTQLSEKNHELEEINNRLQTQSYEITQINSLLDLDNWKLKNRIKEVLNDQIMEKTMEYAQFSTLYPDTLSCYRFLEILKWQTSFECRKCNCPKFFNGAHKFSRRCTRCGYDESITSYTIFHSIKFPIEKAFYIAYLVVAGKKEATLESIATTLKLRTNTVWAFKHKVLERITELSEKGKKPTVSRWEEVILPPHPAGKQGRIAEDTLHFN